MLQSHARLFDSRRRARTPAIVERARKERGRLSWRTGMIFV
jgi:hypothetical protein